MILVGCLAARASADAVDPHTWGDYNQLVAGCKPSCYQPAQLKQPQPSAKKGCGSKYFIVGQQRQGEGWTATQATAASRQPYAPLECRAFPKGGEARDVQAIARTALGAQVVAKDVIAVQSAKAPWTNVVNPAGEVVGRTCTVRVYRAGVQVQPAVCGDGSDPLLSCEASGSLVVLGASAMAHHLREASTLKDGGEKGLCRAAARQVFSYADNLQHLHDRALKNKNAIAGARYLLADGHTLDDAELWIAVGAGKAQAAALFVACGGTGEPPIADRSGYKVQTLDALKTRQAPAPIAPPAAKGQAPAPSEE